MKSTPVFKNTIRDYLEKRGSKDPLFARIITKPGKNMDDCITYILNTVQKSGCNGFTDDEVYNMAIHYFDEDNVNIGSVMSNIRVVVNHKIELTEEDKKQAHDQAMKEEVEKARAKILGKDKKPEIAKTDVKDKPVEKSLF
jgi:hypothetical protein